MRPTALVMRYLRLQRDDAVREAATIMNSANQSGGVISLRDTDELESRLGDAERAGERLRQLAITVGREPLTYRQDSPHSFFVDMATRRIGSSEGGQAAEERLQRHRQEMDVEMERREALHRQSFDVAGGALGMTRERRDLTRTDTAGGYFAPPLWLLDEAGDFPRSGRVLADRVTSVPLPAGTDSVSVPRLTTGTATAIQTADNAAVQETDAVIASATGTVRTVAGQADAAVQLVDQTGWPGFDRVVFADLLDDYNAKLEAQLIAGSNASGQLPGLLTSPGTTVTYTDASPTPAELYAKIGDLAAQVATARQRVPTLALLAPRRAFWMMSQPDAQNRPLNLVDLAASAPDANVEPVGSLLAMAMAMDPAMPTNLGAGTNEDRIIVTRASDHLLLEGEPRLRVMADVLSGTLTVRFGFHCYVAFISQRAPSATGVLDGTGLVTPSW